MYKEPPAMDLPPLIGYRSRLWAKRLGTFREGSPVAGEARPLRSNGLGSRTLDIQEFGNIVPRVFPP